ncbi:hypothetical protein ACK3TF_004403 [Chlorella vulgaris]
MTRQPGSQRPPLSPIRNRGSASGAAAGDALGSSTKDKAWQRRPGTAGRASRMQPAPSSDKKSKKVEGTVVLAEAVVPATAHAPASRIPAHSRPAPDTALQPPPSTGGMHSRIPKPPSTGSSGSSAASAAGASPQPDYAAMLATPAAPAQLPDQRWTGQSLQPRAAAGDEDAAGLQAFQAYSNPSFDGADFLAAAAPDQASPLRAECSNISAASSCCGAAQLFLNSLADAEAGAGQLTPGLLEAAALSPATERSLQAWLRASPDALAAAAAAAQQHRQQPGGTHSMARSGGLAGSSLSAAAEADSRGRPMATPEAWQLLQHINNGSPGAAAAPKGVRGIMNAFLRTGPQMLSPEPSCEDVIWAPNAAAVPASGLLSVAGPGGVGVYGMVHAFLRTGANLLSPEPGKEAQLLQEQRAAAAAAPPAPLLQPYSPASPLAATPGAPQVAALTAVQPLSASVAPPAAPSVCSNEDEVGSCGPAASISLGGGVPHVAQGSVPRLNLCRLPQSSCGTEVSFGAALAAVRADSPDSVELPTARFFAGGSPQAAAAGADLSTEALQASATAAQGVQRQRHRPTSPVTFCLPADSPDQESLRPASAAPSFSFGLGGPAAAAEGVGSGGGGVEVAQQARHPTQHLQQQQQQLEQQQQQQQHVGPNRAAGSFPPQAAVLAAQEAEEEGAEEALPRNLSGETVQQAHPFMAMLQHLQAPHTYASPARLLVGGDPGSPESPRECTPLHLISTSEAQAQASPGAVVATPAPGQGSMTVWLDRRGMCGALNTPARHDLRLLWSAARDIAVYKSEAAALLADNATLAEELESTQAALSELGAEHQAAVVAAQAGALCAEAEVARARDAAGHMMQLADQIQGMFALCENEKQGLVEELAAAQQQLAASEAAAADNGAHADERQAAQLQQQLEEARQAVAAAQHAADSAQQRAGDASSELESIRLQLDEAQQQLAAARGAPQLTPMTKLRCQLGNMHASLAQLHAEQSAGRLPTGSLQLEQLLDASRDQLSAVEELLGGTHASTQLRQQNERLHQCLAQARTMLADSSPGPASTAAAARPRQLAELRSPLPFALLRDGLSSSRGTGAAYSPATTVSDVFASPYPASQATLTVDYRDLHGSVRQQRQARSGASGGSPAHSAGTAATLQSPGAGGGGEDAGPCLSPGSLAGTDPGHECGDEAFGLDAASSEASLASRAYDEGGEAEAEYTVVHNGMAITHVPASEVSKVQSMVQYWEAVASGTPLCGAQVSDETAAEAEAYASAAVAAAQAAVAAREAQAAAAAAAHRSGEEQEEAVQHLEASPLWLPESAAAVADGSAAGVSPGPEYSPAATHGGAAELLLPAGQAATPARTVLPPAAATPARFTPLHFVSAPPPTPASASASNVGSPAAIAVSASTAAAGSTPASAQRTASRRPSTPGGTPPAAGSTVAVAVTPLALSALRARMGGSGGGVQDAVRSRLARLKADLMAAQAKLATVDQGLASIAFTPSSSITASGSRASSMLRRTPPTPFTNAALGSPLAHGSSAGSAAPSALVHQQQADLLPGGTSSSRAAALIAAGTYSPAPEPAPAVAPVAAAGSQDSSRGAQSKSPAAPPAPAEAASAAAASGLADTPLATEAFLSPAALPAPAAAAAGDECTPQVGRRSVRFAETVQQAASSQWAVPRTGTPYSGPAAAAALDAAALAAAGSGDEQAYASPVVASSRRSPLGFAGNRAGSSPLARSPLAAAQSAAKPAPALHLSRAKAAGGGWGGSGSSSSSDDEGNEALFDASRMAQRGNHAATPSPLGQGLPASATPTAHPRRFGGQAGGGATPTTATSALSTSSFSPPRPLVLLALGRAHRRGALLRGGTAGGGGRRRSETDEREFRRRAAALNIQISPYFRRPRSAEAQAAEAE